MPFYFQFLTLLAFHVFLHERVDLAVIEVGIGGEYDCTNIIRKPWVCGVTSLDLDHCSLLGDTIEKIAWQKAGIFKPGVPAFTVSQHPGALKVLQDRAQGIGCPLSVCPELDHYEALVGPLSLGLVGAHQRLNASLALQLSNSWLQHKTQETGDGVLSSQTSACTLGSPAVTFQLTTAMLTGLQQTEWLGRNQTLRRGSVTYYLDGAHTSASMKACVCWFKDQTKDSKVKILLFNTTGERDSTALLKLLIPCQFDFAVFCPNIDETSVNSSAVHSISSQHMLSRWTENQSIWLRLNASQSVHEHHRSPVSDPRSHCLVFLSISSALQWIRRVSAGMRSFRRVRPPSTELCDRLTGAGHVSVLVTGSLYLVGGALKHLDPPLDSQGHDSVNL